MNTTELAREIWSAIAAFRAAKNEEPNEIRLSPTDFDMFIRESGGDPEKSPRSGSLFGCTVFSHPEISPGRVRIGRFVE